jgi:hypothetical protein
MRSANCLLILAALALLSCGRAISPAHEPVEWATLAERQMILVSTTDPEGRPRVTRLWIVVIGDAGYLRSADTGWARDVARNPEFGLIVDSVSYPVRASSVPFGTEEHARVMEAFAEKYGLLGRTVLGFYSLIGRYSGPSDARILRVENLPEHESFSVGMSRATVLERYGAPTDASELKKRDDRVWGPIEDFWPRVPPGSAVEIWKYRTTAEREADSGRRVRGTTELYFVDRSTGISGLGFAPDGVVYESGGGP